MAILPDAPTPCSILSSAASLRAARDELASLAEQPGAASSIVQHPDWLEFELTSRGAAVEPHVIVARHHDGGIAGYAPLIAGQHHARIAFGTRQITLYRGHALRLLGYGVVALPTERSKVESAIVEVLTRNNAIKVVQIQETVLPNTLAQALSSARDGYSVAATNLLPQINWSISVQPSLAAYLGCLGPRRKKLAYALRNVYKKLGKEAHFRVFESPEQIDEYCRLVNELYAKSWHAKARSLDWESPARRALFVHLATRRQLVGHMLMVGPRPVAYVHGYRLGGRYLLDDTGYDDEFAALGVGSALVFQAIQDLIERYPRDIIDFGYGDNQYKRVLATDKAPCGSLYLVRGPAVRARFSLISPLRATYRRVREARDWLRSTASGRQ
jgi:hypothetical protein